MRCIEHTQTLHHVLKLEKHNMYEMTLALNITKPYTCMIYQTKYVGAHQPWTYTWARACNRLPLPVPITHEIRTICI